MSDGTVSIRIKLNYPVVLIAVLLLHALLIFLKAVPGMSTAEFAAQENEKPTVINLRQVKTNAVRHPNIIPQESVINASAPKAPAPNKPKQEKRSLSLEDFSASKVVESSPSLPVLKRPGTRPEVRLKSARAEMNKISLKSKEFKEVSRAFPSGGISISDMMSGAQKVSDAVVSIEVPEGIEPDQLNEYELMFYSFQKRTAMNYINSILKNIDQFQKKYPNYRLPSQGRITMTARINYDPEGNVKQIKMIRWTHINEVQSLFEDIVKNIDQLHNPPKALWQRDGEFAMFYTLEIING